MFTYCPNVFEMMSVISAINKHLRTVSHFLENFKCTYKTTTHKEIMRSKFLE
jgi:hypothetical protein